MRPIGRQGINYPRADVLSDEEARHWVKVYSPAECERAYHDCTETDVQRALAMRWGIDGDRIKPK